MGNVEAELAALAAETRSGFAAVNRRLDDHRDEQRERHVENVERLERIEAEARDTNGRVTRHDEQLKTLFKGHSGRAPVAPDFAKVPVNIATLRQIVLAIVGTVIATFSVMVALGWHR